MLGQGDTTCFGQQCRHGHSFWLQLFVKDIERISFDAAGDPELRNLISTQIVYLCSLPDVYLTARLSIMPLATAASRGLKGTVVPNSSETLVPSTAGAVF